MRRSVQIVIVLLVGTILVPAELVDRIVATVNRQPILLSDWEIAMRYEAFIEQRPLPLSAEAARAALDRVIDQELLRQQLRGFHVRAVSDQEVADRVQEIRKNTPSGETDSGFQAALARYGLTEPELAERVANQLAILRFVEVRLRPAVHIDRRTIETYYNEKLLPDLRQKGGKDVPLAEVSAQIEELLSEQRMDAILSDWLKDLRQQSDIHIEEMTSPANSSHAAVNQRAR